MLTLIIPTMNRSDFLIRSLRYYADTNYKYQLCIGDSSDSFHVDRAKKVIEELRDTLNITYLEYPGACIADCIQRLNNQVNTPYTTFIADDDFLVPKSLEMCIKFLEENSDYSAVHGKAAVFSLQSSKGAYGEFRNVGEYRQRAIEGETASERLLDHLASYSVMLFSVHRTQTWKKLFRDIRVDYDRAFMEELLPCSLSVVYGKVKQLDLLYLIRQGHDQRAFHADSYDWVTGPNWYPSYQIYSDVVTKEIMEQDGKSIEEVRRTAKKAFWLYLNNDLNNIFQRKYEMSRMERIKKCVKKIPILVSFFRMLHSIKLFSGEMSLTALMSKKSPYHEDFMPIFEVVSQVAKREVKI